MNGAQSAITAPGVVIGESLAICAACRKGSEIRLHYSCISLNRGRTSKGPGLKAALFLLCFRGLKSSAPSVESHPTFMPEGGPQGHGYSLRNSRSLTVALSGMKLLDRANGDQDEKHQDR